jgi:hypothetical protein
MSAIAYRRPLVSTGCPAPSAPGSSNPGCRRRGGLCHHRPARYGDRSAPAIHAEGMLPLQPRPQIIPGALRRLSLAMTSTGSPHDSAVGIEDIGQQVVQCLPGQRLHFRRRWRCKSIRSNGVAYRSTRRRSDRSQPFQATSAAVLRDFASRPRPISQFAVLRLPTPRL